MYFNLNQRRLNAINTQGGETLSIANFTTGTFSWQTVAMLTTGIEATAKDWLEDYHSGREDLEYTRMRWKTLESEVANLQAVIRLKAVADGQPLYQDGIDRLEAVADGFYAAAFGEVP